MKAKSNEESLLRYENFNNLKSLSKGTLSVKWSQLVHSFQHKLLDYPTKHCSGNYGLCATKAFIHLYCLLIEAILKKELYLF